MSSLPESEVAVIGSTNLTKVELNGIANGLTKHQNDGAEFKGIKAHFSIDDSGLLSLGTVESTFEKVHPVVTEDSAEAANSTQGIRIICQLTFVQLCYHNGIYG
jgi:hypoxia up-regulated 1